MVTCLTHEDGIGKRGGWEVGVSGAKCLSQRGGEVKIEPRICNGNFFALDVLKCTVNESGTASIINQTPLYLYPAHTKQYYCNCTTL